MPSVSDVMSEMLRAEGIDLMFGVPGGENIEFMESARQNGIRYILTKREANAGFMADMYGQLTGRPGVSVSTLGPGSTSLLNSVANAYLDRSPMLAITGQVNTSRLATWTHQNIDHHSLFLPITKMTAAMSSNAVPGIMRRALRTAMAPRPGPVHLDLSGDVAASESSYGRSANAMPQRVLHVAQAFASEGSSYDVVKQLLKKSRHPVVVAGLSASWEHITDELVPFCEAWSIPVVTTPKGKGVMPENHPLFAGVFGVAAPGVVAEFLGSADLILAVGMDPVDLNKSWAFDVPTVHIDVVPNTDQVYAAEVELVGDIRVVLATLSDASGIEPKWDPKRIEQLRQAIRNIIVDRSTSTELAPHQVVLECREAFGDEAIVTTDVGSHKMLVGQLWETRRPRTLFQSNGLSAMGFSLPAAMAAKLVYPDRPVLCLTGDGGFSMALSELEVAVEHELNVVTVVFSDASLNRIQIKQKHKGYEYTGTRTRRGHLAKVAEGFGAIGILVENCKGLRSALEEVSTATVPVVIEAIVDPSEYEVQF